MSRGAVVGEGATRDEAIADLRWRVNLQGGFEERNAVVYREGDRYVAAFRLMGEYVNLKRFKNEP